MDDISDPVLRDLKAKLDPAQWARRVAQARELAVACERIVGLVEGGLSLGAAIRQAYPARLDATWRDRVERFRRGGVDGLIDRRYVAGEAKLTEEVKGLVRGLMLGRPDMKSHEVAEAISRHTGVPTASSTIRPFLAQEGLSCAEGRPPGTRVGAAPEIEPLPLAGAELLKAAAMESGAVRQLARDISDALGKLPAPDPEEVLDDRGHRDDHGRFLSSYNAGQARGEAEVGPRFQGAAERRRHKDLREMQVAQVSEAVLHRKTLAMVLLPIVIPSPRWDALSHWQGDHLGPLVGFPYQPETLDKFLRELKLAGVADIVRDSVATFWIDHADPVTGAILLYGDTTTKPIWTHHFARSVPVSKLGGRVMPATSTVSLHTGCGTPVIYRAFSGHVSLPKQVPAMLKEYEDIAGAGSAKRVIVLDREGHAVWLFKELEAADWSYIIPLCNNVTGPKAHFEDLGEWRPYHMAGDEVREGRLLLGDSRPDQADLWVRVIARRRRRTGKIAWYATNTDIVAFDASTVIDTYFARWPLQEHVFRDANGRVGLDVHHGFGRIKGVNVAVVGAMEKLDGRLRKIAADLAKADADRAALVAKPVTSEELLQDWQAWHREARAALDEDIARGRGGTRRARDRHQTVRVLEDWLAVHVAECERRATAERTINERVARLTATRATIEADRAALERRREIYTIDIELDEVMTAFKLTFMNLCRHFCRNYLGDEKVELETLIQAVFSLPGERVRTDATETIRIWRQARDRRFMPLVEQACTALTARCLVVDDRRLVFDVVDPAAPPRPARKKQPAIRRSVR